MKVLAEYRATLGIAVGALLLAGVIVTLYMLDAHGAAVRLIEELRAFGLWGALGLVLVHAIAVVLLLPTVFFTVGAGFFFGPVVGTLCIVAGQTSGAAIAFLIARHGMGERAEKYIASRPRLHSLSREVTGEGWKLVLLTRLIPFFPFKLSNYFFGLSGFRFRGFVAATAVGVIPITVTNVYMGAMAADVTAVTAGVVSHSPAAWAVRVAGLIALAVLVALITRRARRALERVRQRQRDNAASAEEDSAETASA